MKLQEFIDFYNYECCEKGSEGDILTELDDETLNALRIMINNLMVKHVDEIDEVPEYEFIDKQGRIKLKESL